ncbi:hypothetical protein H0H93_007070 [Arthromyces matolae]|nr:hypothetical protein H0H93_007070 [Arthromyces matolae]
MDEGGSRDLEHVLQPQGYLEQRGLILRDGITDGELRHNVQCANTCFTAVLASRFLIFQALLAAYEGYLQDKTRRGEKVNINLSSLKKIWLLVQLDRSLLVPPDASKDIFVELSTLLCHVEEPLKLNMTVKAILGPSRRFIQRLQAHEPLSGKPMDNYVHFFCVLDEAQVAASAYPHAFRSSRKDEHRPALRALLQQWAGFFGLIVTGTSLNLASITTAISSSVGKSGNIQKVAVNDTGAFTDQAKIDGYLKYYLPPGYYQSKSGQELRRRGEYWLSGRLLTLYIKAITGGFVPNDAIDWEAKEAEVSSSILGKVISFDFERGSFSFIKIFAFVKDVYASQSIGSQAADADVPSREQQPPRGAA